jgi:hypothetical protein
MRFLPATLLFTIPTQLAAQGLPTGNGPQTPVALWVGGAVVLAIAIAYGIMRNKSRSTGEKQLTDTATRSNYAEENKRAKSTGID